MKYNKIAILMAMKQEALPLIKYFRLKKIGFYNPIDVYANEDKSLLLSLSGQSQEYGIDNIGSQAATLNTFVVINNFSPDLVINCGTAGGFKSKNAKIGDVYISKDRVLYHDRRISLPGGYREYGFGNYNVINSDLLAKKFKLKQGIISTGDAFDLNKNDLKIMQENDVEVKEMEAAAIAWVCQLYNIDFIAIKAITDFIDEPEKTSMDFMNNLDLASKRLKEKIIEIIDDLLL